MPTILELLLFLCEPTFLVFSVRTTKSRDEHVSSMILALKTLYILLSSSFN